jgi:preprotein translocase SecE subunit
MLEKYKWGQGKDTRLYSAAAVAVIAVVGCYRLYEKLKATMDLTQTLGLWLSICIPLGLVAIIGGLIYWLSNRPSVADFLISAEGELKKVSFSSKREIAVSTTIVIVVVLLMSAMLGVADFVFDIFFTNVLGI